MRKTRWDQRGFVHGRPPLSAPLATVWLHAGICTAKSPGGMEHGRPPHSRAFDLAQAHGVHRVGTLPPLATPASETVWWGTGAAGSSSAAHPPGAARRPSRCASSPGSRAG
jgi:hypothetical protein